MPPTKDQEEIIRGERIAILATVRRDGGPQMTPINYVYEDSRFLISTTRSRAKYHNIHRNPQVSLCIVRQGGRPYLTVFGRAQIEETEIEEGTAAIFRSMSDRPLPDNFGDVLREQGRILIIVTPERFIP